MAALWPRNKQHSLLVKSVIIIEKSVKPVWFVNFQFLTTGSISREVNLHLMFNVVRTHATHFTMSTSIYFACTYLSLYASLPTQVWL